MLARRSGRSVVTWADFRWIREVWGGPIIAKSVLTGDDARRAIDHGADAIVVSNHGGRQLDCVSATLKCLPEIVKAVNGQVEVLMDGGVRRGSDVVKALCLGARAVLVGTRLRLRPWRSGRSRSGARGRDSEGRSRTHTAAAWLPFRARAGLFVYRRARKLAREPDRVSPRRLFQPNEINSRREITGPRSRCTPPTKAPQASRPRQFSGSSRNLRAAFRGATRSATKLSPVIR